MIYYSEGRLLQYLLLMLTGNVVLYGVFFGNFMFYFLGGLREGSFTAYDSASTRSIRLRSL